MLNCMNLYQDSKPLQISNQTSIVFINLVNNTLITFTFVNIRIFLKKNSVLFLIIESTNKNNNAFLDVMDKINVIQLEIEQHHFKVHDHNFK
jgi:hypothetical protein